MGASEHDTAILSLCVTLVLALVGVVWKAGGLIGTMTSALAELRTTIAELKAGLEHVRDFPLVKQRVEQLEDIVQRNLTARVETLWAKVFSLDSHRAVQEAVEKERQHRPQSSPDLSTYHGSKKEEKS